MRPPSATWSRPVLILIGLLVVYYAYPVEWTGDSVVATVVSLAATVGGLALVGTVLAKELGYVRHGAEGRGARVLGMLLVLLVMGSSLTFYLLNQVRPDEVSGLETRTDALYFTLSTMSTVGFGDVHAEGQIARVLVCVLIIFNVVVVASLVRIYAVQGPGTTGAQR